MGDVTHKVTNDPNPVTLSGEQEFLKKTEISHPDTDKAGLSETCH